MPSSGSASPSRAASSTPCFLSFSPQAVTPVARMARQSSVMTRRVMRPGILVRPSEPRPVSRVHPGVPAEPRRLVRLVAGDGGALQLHPVRLLEHHAEPVERLPGLPLDPAGRPDLLEAVHQGRRLAEGRELDPRDARGLAREVVYSDRAVAAAAAVADLLDDLPGAVGPRDRQLRVLVRERRVELEPRGGAEPDRLAAGEPVVVHVVACEGGPRREVRYEVEDLLARRRDDGRYGALAHARAIVPAGENLAAP